MSLNLFYEIKHTRGRNFYPKKLFVFLDDYKKYGIKLPQINLALFGYEDKIIQNMNTNYYYDKYSGGSNSNTMYAGDKWVDMPEEFHKKYHSGYRQNKRNSGDPILISFYRFNKNYTYNIPVKNLNLTSSEKDLIKKGVDIPAIILYTIINPLGGPTYKVFHNKKRQELLDDANCIKWEENNVMIKDE